MAEPATADDAHVVGQVLLIPFEHPRVGVGHLGPGVGLELFPGGDGASSLGHELTPAGAPQPSGIIGSVIVERHGQAFDAGPHMVITQETLDDDLGLDVEIRVIGIESIPQMEPPGHSLADLLIEKQFDVVRALRRALAEDAAVAQLLPIGGHRIA